MWTFFMVWVKQPFKLNGLYTGYCITVYTVLIYGSYSITNVTFDHPVYDKTTVTHAFNILEWRASKRKFPFERRHKTNGGSLSGQISKIIRMRRLLWKTPTNSVVAVQTSISMQIMLWKRSKKERWVNCFHHSEYQKVCLTQPWKFKKVPCLSNVHRYNSRSHLLSYENAFTVHHLPAYIFIRRNKKISLSNYTVYNIHSLLRNIFKYLAVESITCGWIFSRGYFHN